MSAASKVHVPPNAVGNLYRIVSEGTEYYILAGGFNVLSNLLESYDSSLVYAGIDRKDSDYGTILAKG